jgi:hypothetical protein
VLSSSKEEVCVFITAGRSLEEKSMDNDIESAICRHLATFWPLSGPSGTRNGF